MAKNAPEGKTADWKPDNFNDFEAYFQRWKTARDDYATKAAAHDAKLKEAEAAAKAAREALEKSFSDEITTTKEQLAAVQPIGAGEVDDLPRRRAAYSDRTAALMAKLALLSYVKFEAGSRPVLENALDVGGFALRQVYDVDDTQAILVECAHFVAVAFRGTTTGKDWETNMRAGVDRVLVEGHPARVRVHKGFYEAFKRIENPLRADLHKLSADKPVFLTGHSLGGALALVASAAFSGSDALGERIAAVYTYGAPRTGGNDFPVVVKAPHYRIINAYDCVPLIPPNWLFSYRHTGNVRFLKKGAKRPKRSAPPASAVWWGLLSLVLWPFAKQPLFMKTHDIALYAARLDAIAQERSRWT
jgi:hypothetical protein